MKQLENILNKTEVRGKEMKNLLKKFVFGCVMIVMLPIYALGMSLLFVAAMVTGLLCDWMEN